MLKSYEAKERRQHYSYSTEKSDKKLQGLSLFCNTQHITDQLLLKVIHFVDGDHDGHLSHSERVTNYAALLGKHLGLPDAMLKRLIKGGLFHDVGKIGISPSILFKKDALNFSEYQVIKQHPEIGAELLRHFPDLWEAIPVVRYHHERFDGSGYPCGLVGNAIPIEAQIVGLVDSFDALTMDRPYRMALPADIAMQILQRETEEGRWNPYLFVNFQRLLTDGVLRSVQEQPRKI
jgi:putative nucleotidyltransferase with HDIG domain